MPDRNETPRCEDCELMWLEGRAQRTAANRYGGGPRGQCFCKHPDAVESFRATCPRSPRTPGFIAFTAPGGYVPQVKTSPRWCPLRGSSGPGGG